MMLTRKAILIEAGGDPDEKDYLAGANVDVRLLEGYLRSLAGGAWAATEIESLHNPSLLEVEAAIESSQGCDYCFISLSGHGYHLKGRTVNKTQFLLTDGDSIDTSMLSQASDRCAIIMDCCRHVQLLEEVILESTMVTNMRKAARIADRFAYRYAFDKAIMNADAGCSILYSCDVGEAAQENESGGYYIQSLIAAASEWFTSDDMTDEDVYDLYDVHRDATSIVRNSDSPQTPKRQLGRRLTHFPFAVKL